MAKTISELRNQSIQVRDASAAGENTATRVGTVLNDIVGHIEDYENTQSSNNSTQDVKIEGVKSSLNAEIARAKTEESNLSTLIGTERTERQAAMSSEETARIQADNAEKTARQQADNAEQDARIKADNAEKTARENADITLRTMIQTETSDREKAVAAEAARAQAAEQANAQAIADETARAMAAEEAETARATAEEERLQGEIDNTNDNVSALDDKVNSNNVHLTDEVARLDTTDAEIKADLEAETARATEAEEANAQAIADETARATAAEKTNVVHIDSLSEYPSYNLIDPNNCVLAAYINNKGNITKTEFKGYFLAFVKAPIEGIIININTSSFPTYKVIKEDGSERFFINNTYIYENGDKFVYIALRDKSIDTLSDAEARKYIANNIAAYRGVEIPSKFIPYSITKKCQDNISSLESIIQNESNRAKGKEQELETAITDELERAENVEISQDFRIHDLESLFSTTEEAQKIEVYKKLEASYISKSKNIIGNATNELYYTNAYKVKKGDVVNITNKEFRYINNFVLLSFAEQKEPKVGTVVTNIYDGEYDTDKGYSIDFTYTVPNDGYIICSCRVNGCENWELTKPLRHLQELDSIVANVETVMLNSLITNLGKVTKNQQGLWMNKTVITYKKPNVEVDNIQNFDNLMNACVYANERANIINQYEIQIYEDVISTGKESDFSAVPSYNGLHALFYVNEYIKLRGIGTMKTIHGELLPENVTSFRFNYETGHFDGGELENLRITARNIRYPVHFERGGNVLAQNKIGSIKYCDIIHFGGINETEGTETSPYKAWDAWGMGSSQGTSLDFLGCNIIGERNGFRCHTNKIFEFPTRFTFNDCTIIGYGGNAFNLDENSCKCVTEYVINNCNIQGYITFRTTSNNSPYVPYGMKITGSGNTTDMYYREIGELKGLRLKSNNINVSCEVIQDDANLFGDKVYRKGENGLAGYVCGLNTNNATTYNLANKIGDCSLVVKILTVKIGNSEFSKVFNSDYTGMSNDVILDELNNLIGDSGVFDLYNPNIEYYAELTDVLYYKKNVSGEVIYRGQYVQFDGNFNVVKTDSRENAKAICVADCGIGEIGRFRTNI